jgi:hypothetical protein
VKKQAVDRPAQPVERLTPQAKRLPSPRRRRPLSREDTLWRIVGIGRSPEGSPRDVARNTDRYLAEAYADKHDAPSSI